MSEEIIVELIQQLYKMINYINSTTYTQNHKKFSGKYGDFEYIFSLPYDQALQEFNKNHGRKSKSEPKPTPLRILICFRCGAYGHIYKTCKSTITQCSIPTCKSLNHNIKGHKVKQEKEVGVCTDDITTPVNPVRTPPQGESPYKSKQKGVPQPKSNYKCR